jgi:hypothetical protein
MLRRRAELATPDPAEEREDHRDDGEQHERGQQAEPRGQDDLNTETGCRQPSAVGAPAPFTIGRRDQDGGGRRTGVAC